MEVIAHEISSFIHHKQVKAIRLPSNAPYRSVAELYRLLYKTFHREEALQAEIARIFWNPIIKKESKVDDKQQCDLGLALYFLTNKLLRQYLMVDEESVCAGFRWAVLDVLLSFLLTICALDEPETHLVMLPAADVRHLLFRFRVKVQVRQKGA